MAFASVGLGAGAGFTVFAAGLAASFATIALDGIDLATAFWGFAAGLGAAGLVPDLAAGLRAGVAALAGPAFGFAAFAVAGDAFAGVVLTWLAFIPFLVHHLAGRHAGAGHACWDLRGE
ncbi:hypothetical protein [Elioraea rosea]|uniref:hypothetical protein n=1 Tax=Elioraea rosea TaxID=2492390 RepID=UPI0019504983|nr:hypothetical protein [Elioraea rosea]